MQPSRCALSLLASVLLFTGGATHVTGQTPTLGEAADAPGLEWYGVGSYPPFGQTAVTFDGEDAVQCGQWGVSQDATLKTIVRGPGTLAFRLKVDVDAGGLIFQIGPGWWWVTEDTDWELWSMAVPPGDYMTTWQQTGLCEAWIDQVTFTPGGFPADLAEALDDPALTWTTSSQGGWYAETGTSFDGVDAARTGYIGDNEQSWLRTHATGPGILRFRFRVETETGGDYLTFTCDDTPLFPLSGSSSVFGGPWLSRELAVGPGEHTFEWVYAKNSSYSEFIDACWLDDVHFTPIRDTPVDLNEALETPGWSWTHAGSADWFGQANFSHDGVDAGQSGPVRNGEYSALETELTGPGIIAFWWGLRAASLDSVEFRLDGVRLHDIPGGSWWDQRFARVPPGEHTLQWAYLRGPSGSVVTDCAWLDQVTYQPDAEAVPLAQALDAPAWGWTTSGEGWFGQSGETHDGIDAAQSTPMTGAPMTAGLSVTVTGPVCVAFWWKIDSYEDPGDPHASHTFAFSINATPQDTIRGATDWTRQAYQLPSGPQTLEWLYTRKYPYWLGPETAWLDQVKVITNATTPPVIMSHPTNQYAQVGGSATFTVSAFGSLPLYYQWRHDEAPVGASAATLELSDITPADAGRYAVVVSNAAGAVTSSYATLSVQVPLDVALDAPGLAWSSDDPAWSGQTNVTHDGIDGARSGDVDAGGFSSLYLDVEGPGRVDFWWKMTGDSATYYFITDGHTQDALNDETDWEHASYVLGPGAHNLWWAYYIQTAGSATDAAWLDQVVFTPGNFVTLEEALDTSDVAWLTDGDAGWFGQTNVTHDGEDAAQNPMIGPNQTAILATTVDRPGTVSFWWQVDSELDGDFLECRLNGVLYDRISGSPAVWTQRTCTLSNAPVTVEWIYTKNGATSVGADAGWVDGVVLDLATPPTILTGPAAQTVPRGGTVRFDVVAEGSPPLFYQWFLGETPLTGETNSDLVIAGVTPARQGNYGVAVSNACGSVTNWGGNLTVSIPLDEALDTPGRTWTTNGNGTCIGQTRRSHDGVDGALLGSLSGYNPLLSLRTTVTGPASVTFWWRLLASSYDLPLRLLLDGSPAQEAALNADWEFVVASIPDGDHELEWTFGGPTWPTASDQAWIDEVAVHTNLGPISLAEALDTPGWIWTTDGEPWTGQILETWDGVDAAKSGPIPVSRYSAVQTTVEGPGCLAFRWAVSSEAGYDWLDFTVNGASRARISGGVQWLQRAFPIPAGPAVLRWTYATDPMGSAGADAGWLDSVRFITDSTTPPAFVFQPTGNVVQAGSEVTFDAEVLGSLPLSYQWRLDGTPLPGASGASLTLENVRMDQSGDYTLVVSNAAGVAVSSNAVLTVGMSLAEALDTPELEWTTTSGTPWLGQTDETQDGVDAARTPPLGRFGESRMRTAVTGPGRLTFWWRTSSDWSSRLTLYIDGAQYEQISGEVPWQQNVVLLPAGRQMLEWDYRKSTIYEAGEDAAWVDSVVFTPTFIPLAEALDTPGWNWMTDAGNGWLGVATLTHDGIDGARSGAVPAGGQSRLETTVTGPGVLVFWWSVDSEYQFDTLELRINGTTAEQISGTIPWRHAACVLPAGPAHLEWVYSKDATENEDQDVAALDEVRLITDAATAPVITRQPGGRSAPAGWTAEFSVTAYGSWPWFYQWHRNGAPLTGRTNSVLDVTDVTAADAGTYSVVVSNAAGSVESNPAELHVIDLAEALDTPGWEWSSGGWYDQKAISHDGEDAAHCVGVGEGFKAAMQTIVAGPGHLSFWWRVSVSGNASLNFSYGDNYYSGISGTGDWARVEIDIPDGEQTLSWLYRVDGSVRGENAAWVDQVIFTPDTTHPPLVTLHPTDLAVVAGQTAVFNAAASGSRPLFYQWTFGGLPLAGATNTQLVLPAAGLGDAGVYALAVSNAVGSAVSSNAVLTVQRDVPLPEAVDAPQLVLSTVGPKPWFGQTNVSHDGVDAARSGVTPDGQMCRLDTTLHGPGELSFWWRVSSQGVPEVPYDTLDFRLDGTVQDQISGDVDWEHKTYAIADGTHFLEWIYAKDADDAAGADAGWVDEIVYTPATGALQRFSWSAIASPQAPGEPFAAALTALDGYGSPVLGITGIVQVTAWDGADIHETRTEDFEVAPLDGWRSEAGTTATVTWGLTRDTAAQGNYSLLVNGGRNRPSERNPYTDRPDGIWLPLDDLKPDRISFRVRASDPVFCGGFVVGNGQAAEDAAVFFLMDVAFSEDGASVSGQHLTVHDGLNTYSSPCKPGIWYDVTLDLDWTNRTVVFLADGRLVHDAIPFRGPLVDRLSVLQLFNHNPTKVWYDAIEFVENGLARQLTASPSSVAEFAAGTWNGSVTVVHDAPQVFLRADDGQGHIGLSNPFAVVGFVPLRFLSAPLWTADGIELNLEGNPGTAVTIDESADLSNWLPLVTLPNPDGSVSFTHGTRHPHRYYRARSQP